MANVKLSEKALLEKIQARIVLLRNEKISQQELLDKCIRFSSNNFESFLKEEFDYPTLTPEKKARILKNKINSGYAFPEKTDDELLYGH